MIRAHIIIKFRIQNFKKKKYFAYEDKLNRASEVSEKKMTFLTVHVSSFFLLNFVYLIQKKIQNFPFF